MKFRSLIAYSLFIISCVAWAALPIIPFLPMETEQLLAWGGGTFIFAEVTWWAAILLLGPEVLDLAKRYWQVVNHCRRCATERQSQKGVSEL